MPNQNEQYAKKANTTEFVIMIKEIENFLRANPSKIGELSDRIKDFSSNEGICNLLGIEHGELHNLDTLKMGYYVLLQMAEEKQYPSLPMH